jgi:hypothetical protein
MARTARFTEGVSALVDAGTKGRIDAIDAAYPDVSKGDVIRLALEVGMDDVELRFPVPPVGAPASR